MSGWVSATGEYHDHGKRLRVRRTTLTDGPGEPAPPDLLVEERAPQSLPAPGERIGPYEVIRELGRGGMGAVFAARDTRLGRKVAIKFFSGDHGPEVTIISASPTADQTEKRPPTQSQRGKTASGAMPNSSARSGLEVRSASGAGNPSWCSSTSRARRSPSSCETAGSSRRCRPSS